MTIEEDVNALAQRVRDDEVAEFALILVGTADPNAIVSAGEATSFWDRVNNVFYVNNDGATAWTMWPGGGGAPIPHQLLDNPWHTDTVTNTPPAAGSIIVSTAGFAWSETPHPGVATQYLRSNAAIPGYSAILAGDLPNLGAMPALTYGIANAAGAAATYVRTDATIDIFDAVVPGTIQCDDPAGAGVAVAAARRDHQHAIVNAIAVNIGNANAEGVSTSFSRADHVHDHVAALGVDLHHSEVHVVNSTGPHAEAGLTIGHVLRASGAAAFSFAALIAADIPGLGGVPALTLGVANAAGAAATYIQTDAQVAVFDAVVPTTIQADDPAAAGVIAFAARRDHTHGFPTVAPVNIGIGNAEGSASDFVRSDHVHNHPAGLGTDLHHAQVHVVNSTGPHAEGGLTVGHVLRATGVAAFSFAALIAADLPAHGSTHDVGAGDPVTTTSDGAANHNRILASSAAGAITMDDYFTVNGGTFGIAGNELLTVNAAGTFAFSGISGVSVQNGDWIGAGAGTSWLYDSGNGDITTTANVGIDTTAPVAPLDIYGNLRFGSAAGNGRLIVSRDNVGGGNYRDLTIVGNDIEIKVATVDEGGASQTAIFCEKVSGFVGIATTTPLGQLDSMQGNSEFSLIIGADVFAQSRTNATRKFARFGMPHFTNAEEPVLLVVGDSDGSDNIVTIGGGTGIGNAATIVRFYTAANDTTTTGTERARFTSAGRFGVGISSSIAAKVHVDQSDNSANIPVLILDQGDISEQCINFRSDGVDRDIHLWTVEVTENPFLDWDNSENSLLYGVNTPNTNTITDILTLRQTSSNTVQPLFGSNISFELEGNSGTIRQVAEVTAMWSNAIDAELSPLLRMTTFPTGSRGPGFAAFWTWPDVDTNARIVIAGGAGDVTGLFWGRYVLVDSLGGTITGTTSTAGSGTAPGGTFTLYNVGGNTYTLAITGGGQVTVQKTADADGSTADIVMWMVWI